MITSQSDYAKHSDRELIALLGQGNEYAYTEIFERYKVLLYKHAFRLLGDEDEANDIISDLFLALAKKGKSQPAGIFIRLPVWFDQEPHF